MTAQLRFELPMSATINANSREHWAVRGNKVKNLRAIGANAARQYGGRFNVAHLVITIGYPDKRRRDDHNYMPTFKALIDGVVDAGMLPDDSRDHLIGPDLRSTITGRKGLLGLDFLFTNQEVPF